ncbi:hypothetical protein [Streptobacillus canis]|uniref:hypothetical protein n=1 Tax=Streptobacillus canis TaxID=2678686 RepID=UPI0018CC64BB|nr:hypothetical protein [Streptobacillus canis]
MSLIMGIIIFVLPYLSLYLIIWVFIFAFLFTTLYFLYFSYYSINGINIIQLIIFLFAVSYGFAMLFSPSLAANTLGKIIATLVIFNTKKIKINTDFSVFILL